MWTRTDRLNNMSDWKVMENSRTWRRFVWKASYSSSDAVSTNGRVAVVVGLCSLSTGLRVATTPGDPEKLGTHVLRSMQHVIPEVGLRFRAVLLFCRSRKG